MAKTPPTPQDVKDFQNAIIARNVDGVRKALDKDVLPSTPIGSRREHPLTWLMTGPYEGFVQEARQAGSEDDAIGEEEFKKRGSEIVDLLLRADVKLVNNRDFTSDVAYLADRFLHSPYLEDLTNIVIRTINQSLAENDVAYQPNAEQFLFRYVTALNPGSSMTEALGVLEELHDAVRTQLVKEKYADSTGILGYWMESFKIPPAESLQQIASLAEKALTQAGGNAGTEEQQVQASARMQAEIQIQANEIIEKKTSAAMMQSLITPLSKRPSAEILAEMAALDGMDEAKLDAERLAWRQERDTDAGAERTASGFLNTVFECSDSIDAAAAARARAELLHSLGLTGDKYVEINHENMGGLFNGRGEGRMIELISQADVIFLNKVYDITSGRYGPGSMGNLVIDALTDVLKKRPEELTVFVSGNEKQVREFFADHPVLKDLFTQPRLHLKKLSPEELGEILDLRLAAGKLKMGPEARACALEKLAGSAGTSRTVGLLVNDSLNAMFERHRVSEKPRKDKSTLTKADVEAVTIAAEPVRESIGFKKRVVQNQPATR